MATGGLCLFVAAMAFIAWPRPIPPLHFCSMITGDSLLSQMAPLPGVGDFGGPRNAERFDALFSASHEAQPSMIAVPRVQRSFSDLQDLQLSPGNRLMLYLSVQARVNTRGQTPVLEFGFPDDGDLEWIPVQRLFETIYSETHFSPPLLTVLLLEIEGTDFSLNPEAFGTDLLPLLEKALIEFDEHRLAILCACDAGERSWEYLTEPAANEKPAAGEKPATQKTNRDRVPAGVRQGTAFGHFACQAILEEQAGTVGDLASSIELQVSEYVRVNYHAEQHVQLLLSHRDTARAPLFLGIAPPSASAFHERLQPKQPEDAVADSKDTVEEKTSDESAANESAAESEQKSPDPADVLTELWQQQARLQLTASGVFPTELQELQSASLHAEQLLLHGRTEESSQTSVDADGLRRRIQRETDKLLEQTIKADSETANRLRNWLNPLALEQAVTPAQTDACISCLTALRSGDAAKAERPPEQRTTEFLSQLTTCILKRLDDVPDDTEARSAELKLLTNAFAHADLAGWDPRSFPHQLVTLQNLVTNDHFPADPVAQWQQMEAALSLIRLRTLALNCAVGLHPADPHLPMRTQVWRHAAAGPSSRLSGLLTRLTAAESWLLLGSAGLAPAADLLRSAEQDLQRLLEEIQYQENLQQILDAQRLEVPYLINFLAARLERIELDNATLQDFRRTPTQARSDIPSFDTAAVSATSDIPRQATELQASMLALTRILSEQVDSVETTQRYREHYDRLWRAVNDVVSPTAASHEILTALDVRRLEMIPPFPQFTSRMNVFRDDHLLSVSPAGSAAYDRVQTGFWISFFSIRLLESLGAPADQTEQLWNKWDELRQQIRQRTDNPVASTVTDAEDKSTQDDPAASAGPATSPLIRIRAELAAMLHTAWTELRQDPLPLGTSAFVAVSESQPVLAAFLNQRRGFSWELQSQPRLDRSLNSPESMIAHCDAMAVRKKDGSAELNLELHPHVQPCQVYLLAPRMVSESSMGKMGVWESVLRSDGGASETS
ncbi:MAG: hypothetical protein KDA85_01175, partial [Planctomycetaceae bacterium]|nr:hypothetical protein [Planctomycetaceae bacterium]